MNVGTFIHDIFNRILELCSALGNFLTQTITIGDTEVSFLGILGGVGIAALIVYSILKG